MKRIRCPKCNNYICFDETKYKLNQSLVFICPKCNKQFGIRLNAHKLKSAAEIKNKPIKKEKFGSIVIIENQFHYKQEFYLHIGKNTIGRYMKGNNISCPIETDDPSVDINHCSITVNVTKEGNVSYTLTDGPSNTGTFVNNEILGNREKRIIYNGSLFTIGATTIILRTEF